MNRSVLAAGLAALLSAGALGVAAAQPPAAVPVAPVPPPQISITIYNTNLALVEETRVLDIIPGRQRLEFRDVSAQIRPETVSLSAPGLSIIEQNFDYDLLSPAKMMEKAVGQQVQIVRTNPGNGQEVRETATVLSVNDGVVLRIGDRIEILRDDGVPTRVIFDRVPENLRARPTLSVTVNAAAGGRRTATLSYLTGGLGWKADYVAMFDEKAGRLDLQGWITLTNNSGTTYNDAETHLIAGNVNQGGSLPPQPGRPGVIQAGTQGSATGADYLQYDLPARTTIAQNQNKQVGFLSATGVAASKIYEYRTNGFQSLPQAQSASVAVRFSNSSAGGLGAPLPQGIMRVYIRDQVGDPKFAGENRVGHTPQGSELSVKIGDAFDVTVQPTLTSSEQLSPTHVRYTMSYVVRNARAEPVKVQLIQGGLWRNARVLRESMPGRKIDASTVGWEVPVPANGETIVTFTIDNDW